MRILVLISLLLAGCSVTPAKTVRLPDGSQGYSIDCAFMGDWASCMNKAAQICKGRYEIISQGGSSNGGVAVAAGPTTVSATSQVQEMIVRCQH